MKNLPLGSTASSNIFYHETLAQRGVGLFSKSDTEVIAQMLAQPHDSRVAARLFEDDQMQRRSSVDAGPKVCFLIQDPLTICAYYI